MSVPLQRFRRRLEEVVAVRWTGENLEEVLAFDPTLNFRRESEGSGVGESYSRLELFVGRGSGRWELRVGDWVWRYVAVEPGDATLGVSSDESFQRQYEPAP